MTRGDLLEAAPIARIVSSDERRTAGWLYRWNTGGVSILWISAPSATCTLEPNTSADPELQVVFSEALEQSLGSGL